MKVVFTAVPEGSRFAVGKSADLPGAELDTLAGAGHTYITASEHAHKQQLEAAKAAARKQVEALVVKAIGKAVEREAIVPQGEGENSAETIKAACMKQIDAGADAEFVVGYIDGLQSKDDAVLASRTVMFNNANGGGFRGQTIEVPYGSISIKDATEGYVKASENQNLLCQQNRWDEALRCSREAGLILQRNHMKHDDMLLTEAVKGATRFDPMTIKAATFSDPNTQVGALAGDLILMRNLGFLVAKLNWLKQLSTDLSGEPAKFGQQVMTRYIVVPNVLTWVPGVGFTSDAATIAAANAGTTQSGATTQATGTVTKSVPSTKDKGVTMDMFKAVEVEFPVSLISGTARNLFAEQYSAQLYGLAEAINKHVLAGLFSATWGTDGTTGLTYRYVEDLATWNLKSMIKIKNKFTLARIPDVGRTLLLHPFYHDQLLADTNLVTAKAILALIKKDMSSFEDGELPVIYGVKPLESQFSSATSAGVLTDWVDDANPGTTNIVGFGGNMSAYLFVSRPPQDWTTTLTQLGIPATASIRLVTEPTSGLTVMVFSYVDNGRMSVSQRVCLMWGRAQGDPRSGFLVHRAAP